MKVNAEDFKLQPEAATQFVLPILGKASRADNENPVCFAASNQLPNHHSCFDGLAQTDFIRNQQTASRHSDNVVREEDLMRQKLSARVGEFTAGVAKCKLPCELA